MARCRENLKSLRQSKEQGEQDVEELAAARPGRSDDEVLQLDTLDGDEVAEAKPGAFPVEYGEVLRSLSHLRWMQVLAQVEAKNTEVRCTYAEALEQRRSTLMHSDRTHVMGNAIPKLLALAT